MAKNLVIVESPAKAKTIEKILGSDFQVKSCFGHIRDLEKGNNAIDIANNFQPKYIVPKEKEKVVKELRTATKESQEVWLATDEDREGEAISWHLCEVLKLDPKTTKRIVFHEITPKAIKHAVENPKRLNLSLVNAQQARRVLDRLVGFEISPILWRKVKSSLSAGRVQSVSVRLIVEREREIEKHQSSSSFKIAALFTFKHTNGQAYQLKAFLNNNKANEAGAQQFLELCSKANFSIEDIAVKPAKRSPTAPFTTSTLQQEASRKMGFGVTKTMIVAQKLYEAGKITYMRTDSVNLSDFALAEAKQAITRMFGAEYAQTRQYKNKNSSAQEAHEAIRPTHMEDREAGTGSDEQRLYDLIWKRTLSSQMADAELERTTVTINISTTPEKLVAKGEVVKFEGFLKVYAESTDDETDEESSGLLPPMSINQVLDMQEINATQRFTRPAARYTEASLVKKLEELGIGRPSTYAPTITTIQKREYVSKEPKEGTVRAYQVLQLKNGSITQTTQTEITGQEKNKLSPTDMGLIVNDFLLDHFEQIMDYSFTAKIEKEFDLIAEGNMEWEKMLGVFYEPFHKNVEETSKTAERVTGERQLGAHPENGKPIIARMGRYGPMIQIGAANPDTDEKPQYAKLAPGQSINSVTLEEALELFKLPRQLGEMEGEPIVANTGRFGPYLLYKSKFISIKNHAPLTITLEEAMEVIQQKLTDDSNKTIKAFEKEKIYIYNGKYGPYIKFGIRNVKLPKDTVPETLTLEACQAIIAESKPSKPARPAVKTAAAKAAAGKTVADKTTASKPAAKAPKKTGK